MGEETSVENLQDMQNLRKPVILICPFCGLIGLFPRVLVALFPDDYQSNQTCPECGEEVPLLLHGLHAGSWQLVDDSLKVKPPDSNGKDS